MTTIIVTQEDGEIDEFDFAADTRVIGLGRRATNEVCIPDRSVSATHARIVFEDGSAWVEDLNSTNGTYINGRLVSRQRLEDDDEIILGKIRVTFTREPSRGVAEVAAAESEREASMSLSDKAKAALGRDAGSSRPRLQAVTPLRREEAAASDAAEPEVRSEAVAEHAPAPTRLAPPSRARPVAASAHPLDGLEDELAKQPMHDLDSDRAMSRGAVIEIKNGAKSGQILPIDKPVTTLGRPGIQIAAIMRKPDGYFLMHIESDDSIERPTLNRDSIGDEPVLLHSGDELNVAGIDVEFMLS